MSSEIVGPLEGSRKQEEVEHRSARVLAVEFLGPLTILGGIVWAIFQPYRVVFLEPAGKGLYDYLFQAPLLVIGVGLIFTLGIAPGLIEDLRSADGTKS